MIGRTDCRRIRSPRERVAAFRRNPRRRTQAARRTAYTAEPGREPAERCETAGSTAVVAPVAAEHTAVENTVVAEPPAGAERPEEAAEAAERGPRRRRPRRQQPWAARTRVASARARVARTTVARAVGSKAAAEQAPPPQRAGTLRHRQWGEVAPRTSRRSPPHSAHCRTVSTSEIRIRAKLPPLVEWSNGGSPPWEA